MTAGLTEQTCSPAPGQPLVGKPDRVADGGPQDRADDRGSARHVHALRSTGPAHDDDDSHARITSSATPNHDAACSSTPRRTTATNATTIATGIPPLKPAGIVDTSAVSGSSSRSPEVLRGPFCIRETVRRTAAVTSQSQQREPGPVHCVVRHHDRRCHRRGSCLACTQATITMVSP